MNEGSAEDSGACCGAPADGCVFDKALLARAAGCARVQRRPEGEREWLVCGHPPSRFNCETLLARLRERSTFALRLPPGGRPLLHAQALRLQCGGLAALEQLPEAPPQGRADVCALAQALQGEDGAYAGLPWGALVPQVAAWPPRRRGPPPR